MPKTVTWPVTTTKPEFQSRCACTFPKILLHMIIIDSIRQRQAELHFEILSGMLDISFFENKSTVGYFLNNHFYF